MNTQAIVLAAAAAVSFGGGWLGNGWRLGERANAVALEQSRGSFRALENAHAETIRIQKEKDDAVAKAQAQARTNAAAADSARAERDGLRDELAASRTTFADSTHASLAAYTDTLSVVFEQCTKEYSDVAAKADGHAADANTLFTAWAAIAAVK